MKFTIDCEKYSHANVPYSVRKIMAALDALPDGDMVTSRNLAGIVGYSENHVRSELSSPYLKPYRQLQNAKSGKMYVYGNRKTIEEFRKVVSREENHS